MTTPRTGPPPAPVAAAPVEVPAPAPAVDEVAEAAADAGAPDAAAPAKGKALGTFRFTMYYVAQEADYAPPPPRDDDGEVVLAATTGAPTMLSEDPDELSGSPDDAVTLYARKGCKPLARVGKKFAAQIDLQGTGKLRDGRVLNTAGYCKCPHSPCYMELDRGWAIGPNGRLSPFRSVAVDTRKIPLGTMLYIPELDGARMPGHAPWGGFVHDGCVVADDRGGGINDFEIDFFVAKKAYSSAIYRRHRLKKVTVHDGKGWCQRKDGKVRKVAGAPS